MGDRGERRRTKTVGTKRLGRVAQLAIRHNDEMAEKFIADVEAGRATTMKLGVAMVNSDGTLDVVVEGQTVRAVLRGILKGKHGFFHNPAATTAVRKQSFVVMDGEVIMAVLSSGQASRAQRALGVPSGRASSGNGGFMFNRSSEDRRNAAKRATLLASLNTRKAAPARRSSSEKRNAKAKANATWSFW